MSKPTDKEEVKVILDLYKKGNIKLSQALNLLGYDGPNMHDTYAGVIWPEIKITNNTESKAKQEGLFDIRQLNDGGC